MPKIKCFDIVKGTPLEPHFSEIRDNMSEAEQISIMKNLSLSYNEQIHNELENFKKELNTNYKIIPFTSVDNTEKIKSIENEYQSKIEKAREPITQEKTVEVVKNKDKDPSKEIKTSIKEVANQIRNEEISYNEAIEDESEVFINELNSELFGTKKMNFSADAFKEHVRKQKAFGLSEQEITEGFDAVKKLTKAQKELISEVFIETASTDKAAKELKDAFESIAKGEKPKSVLKRLRVSDVSELINSFKDTLTYKAVSNNQLDKMADFIVESIDLNNANQYINSLISNSSADLRQVLRAKLIVALQKEGNNELATQLVRDMADEATMSGRQTQSLKKAYEILGSKGSPAMRTEFARKYAEAVQQKASQMTKYMADVISEQEATIGTLNTIIHRETLKSKGINKIKDIIANLCGLRNK